MYLHYLKDVDGMTRKHDHFEAINCNYIFCCMMKEHRAYSHRQVHYCARYSIAIFSKDLHTHVLQVMIEFDQMNE